MAIEYRGREYKGKIMRADGDDGKRRSKYDRIEANLPLGIKDEIIEHAERMGVSFAKYLTIAIYNQMDKDDGKAYEAITYSIKLAQGRFDANKVKDLAPGCVAKNVKKANPMTIMTLDDEETALDTIKKYQTVVSVSGYEAVVTEFWLLKEYTGRDGKPTKEPEIICLSEFPAEP